MWFRIGQLLGYLYMFSRVLVVMLVTVLILFGALSFGSRAIHWVQNVASSEETQSEDTVEEDTVEEDTVEEDTVEEDTVEEDTESTSTTLPTAGPPPNPQRWYVPLETVDPQIPFTWEWHPVQSHVQEWLKCPYPGNWCRAALRPGTWVIVDSSGIRIDLAGYDGPNVTVYKMGESQLQTDLWMSDGQAFIVNGEIAEDLIMEFARQLALHTGSSNGQTISLIKHE